MYEIISYSFLISIHSHTKSCSLTCHLLDDKQCDKSHFLYICTSKNVSLENCLIFEFSGFKAIWAALIPFCGSATIGPTSQKQVLLNLVNKRYPAKKSLFFILVVLCG